MDRNWLQGLGCRLTIGRRKVTASLIGAGKQEAGSRKQEAGSRSTYFSELIGRGLGRKQREVSLLQEV